MSSEETEPKLIIDEDWKSQVERERAAAAAQVNERETKPDVESAETPAETTPVETPAEKIPAEPKSAPESSTPMPPASFDFLITMLATQAMLALGQMPGVDGKPQPVDKPLAKHYIDLLGVIETKTDGNLDVGEKKLISEIMHSLRMMFVQVK